MHILFSLWGSIQQCLIPHIEEHLEPLTKKEEEFVRTAELAAIDSHLGPFKWVGNGRKPASRKAIALAFIAKAIWGFPTTAAIIDYLKASRNLRRPCGWESVSDMPSEATFSRPSGNPAESSCQARFMGQWQERAWKAG